MSENIKNIDELYVDDSGRAHRLDGPAWDGGDGRKEWWVHGTLHRTDGPAVERPNGTNRWYQHGCLHRTDGPAVENQDGTGMWFLHGELLTKIQWLDKLGKL